MVTKEQIPPVGTKVKLKMIGCFGNAVEIEAKVAKEPYHHGYITRGGAWSCLYSEITGDRPCFEIAFLPKGKRFPRVVKLDDILEVIPIERYSK